jgi:hypothetical protein
MSQILATATAAAAAAAAAVDASYASVYIQNTETHTLFTALTNKE